MSTYTQELKWVIESIFGSSLDPDEYVQQYHSVTFNGVTYARLPIVPDWSKLGLGTYPLFDNNYRDVLNGKIIDEYFNREIGTETIDNWLLIIRKKMDQIMPYYNKLYESEKIIFDPLATYDLTTTGSSQNNETAVSSGTSKADSTNNSKARVVNQELPQTMLAGSGDYATAATDTNSNSEANSENTQSGTSNTDTNGNSTSNTKGFQGVASDLLVRYRNSIINIDMAVLRDIEDCFMLVLNNGSAYAQDGWY